MENSSMKAIRMHRKVEKIVAVWPEAVRIEISDALALLVSGESLGMPISRPMPTVAPGVQELRFKERSGEYRVFYYTKLADFICIFHAFTKKTKTTPKREIEVGQARLKELL